MKFEVVLRENRKRRIKYLKSIDKVSWIFDHIDFNYAFVHLFGRTKCNGYRFRHQNQTFEPSKRKGKKKKIYIYIYIYGEVRLSMLNALRQVDNTKFIQKLKMVVDYPNAQGKNKWHLSCYLLISGYASELLMRR